MKHIKAETFSTTRIDKVKKSDAKSWMIALRERGLGYSTISSIFSLIKSAFRMAVDDDLIMKNPFDFMDEMIRLGLAYGVDGMYAPVPHKGRDD